MPHRRIHLSFLVSPCLSLDKSMAGKNYSAHGCATPSSASAASGRQHSLQTAAGPGDYNTDSRSNCSSLGFRHQVGGGA
jgi:hypothetical protein